MDLSGISDAVLALWNSIIDTLGGVAPWLAGAFDVASWLDALTSWISAFPFLP